MRRSLAWLALGALLVACTSGNPRNLSAPSTVSSAAAPASARPARIALAELIAAHPFATTLARYDVKLRALEAAQNGAPLVSARAQLASNGAEIVRDARNAQNLPSNLNLRPAAGPLPAASGNVDSGRDVIARFDRALQTRFERASAYRAQRLREQESDTAMEFARAHLGERLRLRLRLHNRLYLTPETRARLEHELAGIDARERSALDRQRIANDASLREYQTELLARGAAQRAALAQDVAAHERAVGSLGVAASAPVPQSLIAPPSRAGETAAAIAVASADLRSRFYALRGMAQSARDDSRRAVDALAAQRKHLRDAIVASIERAAEEIAREKGLGRVYATGAPADAVDITADVRARLIVSRI